MTKTLYINGVIADMDENTIINRSYKSPIFADLQTVAANTTLSIKLPITAHNKAIIKCADVSSVKAEFAYQFFTVDYLEDSFPQIENGKGYLLSVSDKIEISVIFGGMVAFANFKDAKLNQMQLPENTGLILWNDNSKFATAQNIGDIMFLKAHYGHTNPSMQYVHPSVKVTKIIEWINQAYNLNIAPIGQTLIIPCVEKKRYRSLKSAMFTLPAILRPDKAVPISLDNEIQTGIFGYKVSASVPGFINNITFTSSGKYRLTASATTNDMANSQQITTFKVCCNSEWQTHQRQTDDGHCEIDIQAKALYCFEVVLPFISGLGSITFAIKAVDDDMLYGEAFDVLRNLPAFKIVDFIKAIMQIQGVFPVLRGQAIEFASVDTIYANIAVAKDWSDKLLEVKAISYKFASFGQKNLFVWTQDDTVSDAASAPDAIFVENQTLEKEYQCVKLPFAATDVTVAGMASIPIYKNVAPASQPEEVEHQSLKDRIVSLAHDPAGHPIATTISMAAIVADKYQAFQAAIKTPKVIKCQVRLSCVDTAQFDPLIPIYIEQLGGHYAVINLITKENVCEAELLQL